VLPRENRSRAVLPKSKIELCNPLGTLLTHGYTYNLYLKACPECAAIMKIFGSLSQILLGLKEYERKELKNVYAFKPVVSWKD
jgi:hypothetical protein